MSLKNIFIVFYLFFFLGCSTSNSESEEVSNKEILDKINVENLDLKELNIENQDVSIGEAYVDYSYNFLQTSYYKRHLNTMGLLIDPSNNDFIKRFSYSYKKAGEHQKAMHLLQLAIDQETDTNERMAHIGYASWSYLYFYRDYERAIESVDNVLELSKNDLGTACHGEPCLLLKGQALYRMKKIEEAIEAFTSYQDHQENQGYKPMDNFLIVFYKARCLAELKQFDKAITYFSYLIKDNPNAESSYQLAKIYKQKKNIIQAKKHIAEAEKALQNGYSFKEPYFERFDKVFQYQIDDLKNDM